VCNLIFSNRTHTEATHFFQLDECIFARKYKMESRKASESFIVMNELVLPNDTNTFGNLMGGRLMYWMDIAAGMAAGKHCNTPSMTASVDNLSFKNPIKLGNVVHIEAKVCRAFPYFYGDQYPGLGRRSFTSI
jgi:acyl-coenzyme A thioesterase PaaI-like protein